jgi:hypothetical protein
MKQTHKKSVAQTQPQVNSALDQTVITIQSEITNDFTVATSEGPKRLLVELTIDALSRNIIDVDCIVKGQRPDIERRMLRISKYFASRKSEFKSDRGAIDYH